MVAILLAPLVADATRGTRHVHTEVWAELKDLLEVSGLAELVSPELLEDVAMDDGDTEAFVHLKNRNILELVDGLGYEVFLQANTQQGPRVQHLRRSPEYMTKEARQSRRDRLVHKLRTVQRAIDQGIFIPADNPMACARCDFRDHCQFSLVKDDYTALAIIQKGP